MVDLSQIRMSFPNTQTEPETRAIFEAFREEYPQELEEWRLIEQRGLKDGEMTLQPFQALLKEFILERTQCETYAAAISLFLEFRLIIISEIRGCDVPALKASLLRTSDPES